MNDLTQWEHLKEMLLRRQQAFDFTRTDMWSDFSSEVRQACLQLLAQMISEATSATTKEKEDE